MNRIAFAVSLSVALFGCRGDDGGGDDQPGMDGSGSNAGEVTIQEVQNDAMMPGTAIELRGVVVVAIDTFGSRTGEIFVSEPEGGPFSGVKVYGANLSDVATLQVGDLIDITGAEKHEACTMAAPCGTVVFRDGAGLTEVQGDTQGSLVITRVGTGTVPAPSVVDAKAIAAMPTAQRLAEWEKWEGVLVKVENARQVSAYAAFDDGDDQKQFSATSGIKVQSSLVDLGTSALIGTCYTSITGMGDFFFDYLVLPRSAADLAGGGTTCNPMTTSVAATQSSTTPAELVTLTNVVVTGVDNIGTTMNPAGSRGFWVADAATGAENNGVYIFLGEVVIPAYVTVGALVNVSGTAIEFDLGSPPVGDKLTEIQASLSSISDGTGADVVPTPASPSPAITVLNDIGTAGEPWEGVLVTVGPVKLTNLALGGGKMELTGNAASNPPKLTMDDDAFQFGAGALTLNNCYTVTGIMSVQVNDNLRTINPRSALDVIAATGCN